MRLKAFYCDSSVSYGPRMAVHIKQFQQMITYVIKTYDKILCEIKCFETRVITGVRPKILNGFQYEISLVPVVSLLI